MAEVKLEGLDELLNNLQQLGERAGRVENQALRAGGEILREEMSKRAPKRTGELAADIQVSRIKQKDKVKYVEVGPGEKTSWRAKFLEWGTSRMHPMPFVYPSLVEKKEEVIQVMKDTIKSALGI